MDRLRIGVIGLGVGEQHIAGYHKHGQCELLAVCDLSPQRRREARVKHPGVKVYEQAEQLLVDPEIDAVSVASYDDHHYDHVEQALRANKHVFVEKPLCQSVDQARNLRELLSARPSVRLSSNLILRMSPRFCALKDMISENRLGELYYVEGDYNYGRLHKLTEGWRGKIENYSVMCGGGVHIIDLLLWLTGQEVVEVFAYGTGIASRGSGFEQDDTVVSLLRFRNGMIGKVAANFGCVMPHFHALTVYGTKGTFVNGLNHATLHEARDSTEPGVRVTAPYPGVHKGDLIHSFVDGVLHGAAPAVSADDVFRVMAVCFAIDQARREGGTVQVCSL